VPFEDVLPGHDGRAWAVREVCLDERLGSGRIGELQVHDVGERYPLGDEAAGIRLGEPDQAGRAGPECVWGRAGLRPHRAVGWTVGGVTLGGVGGGSEPAGGEAHLR
jgi:hypothetical protein